MLEESPLNPSDGSPDGSNDGPPGGALPGDSLEGITCVSFRRLLDGSNDGPPKGALHLRSPAVRLAHGDCLRPAQSWLPGMCSLHAPAVAGDVGRNRGAAGKVAAGPTLSALRRDC